ncbi:hypothetical protein SKC41_24145 [Mycobacterium sp. 050128]
MRDHRDGVIACFGQIELNAFGSVIPHNFALSAVGRTGEIFDRQARQ